MKKTLCSFFAFSIISALQSGFIAVRSWSDENLFKVLKHHEAPETMGRVVNVCVNRCSSKGVCTSHGCACFPGWSGEDCMTKACKSNCNQQGVCIEGFCKCLEGFSGEECSIKKCPNECSGNGDCIDGECRCKQPWMGADCSYQACPQMCSGHGECDILTGKCICEAFYRGDHCSEPRCKNLCSGDCNQGICECYDGWKGEDCSFETKNEHNKHQQSCYEDSDCSGRGICLEGVCLCNVGFVGCHCSSIDQSLWAVTCVSQSVLYN